MKILFVSTLYSPFDIGGAEATVRLLAKAALSAGDEPVVLTLAPTKSEAGECVVDGVRVNYIALQNIYFPRASRQGSHISKLLWHTIDAFNPFMARTVERFLTREMPDVVSLHNIQGFSSSVWWAVTRKSIPAVQTLHDYYAGCLNSTMFRAGRNCERLCVECRLLGTPRRFLSRRLDGVTAVSKRQLTRLETVGVFEGVVDRRVIHGCNQEASLSRTWQGRPNGPLRLGFLGRLDPIKGLDWALRVVNRFTVEQIVVSVGGRGDAVYEKLLQDTFGSTQVRFEGYVRPAEWFGSIDLLLVPSLWEEPFARVLHEALDHGVPILGAATGGMPELICEGETGFLFRAGDAESLAAKLSALIANPPDWRAMSLTCRARSEQYLLSEIFVQYREAWQCARERRAIKVLRKKPL